MKFPLWSISSYTRVISVAVFSWYNASGRVCREKLIQGEWMTCDCASLPHYLHLWPLAMTKRMTSWIKVV